MNKLSIVIPVFNEEDNLGELYKRLTETVKKVPDVKDCEIIFIDDGSTDNSPKKLKRLAEEDKKVKVIFFYKNFGQHPAVIAGFENCTGDVIVTLDADLQNPPEEIPRLINKLNEGWDVVSGRRIFRKDPFFRKISSLIINYLIFKITKVRLKDYGCMLRAYRREVIDQLLRCREKSKFITALVSWLGVKIVEIDIKHEERKRGKSKYSFFKLLKMNFDLLTGFTTFPIQIVSILGLISSVTGFLIGIYLMVWRIIFGANIGGTVTFLAIISFFFGILLLAVGIIGEYIARIYIEAINRPYYIIREKIGFD